MNTYFFKMIEGKILDGRYRLGSILGEGGIGFVVRAEQLSVGRDVAIKFLSRSADDLEQVVRFKREAKALAMLRHPACLTLHDFDYSSELECYYMVTELVDGVEFGEVVHAGMPLSDALRIMSHVCDALASAHEQGILHRDLKPQNVMVTRSHSAPVKLLDFGLARLYQSTFGDEPKVSRTGHIYGTPAYMSPEQCMAHEDIGPASDIYSLGVMLYELCSGSLPFDSGTMTKVLLGHVQEEVEPLNEPNIPEELQSLVNRMLMKHPEDRPQDLYDVRAALEDAADDLSERFPRSKTPLPLLEAIGYATPTSSGFLTAPANHPTLPGTPDASSEVALPSEPDVTEPDTSALAQSPDPRRPLHIGLTVLAGVAALLMLGFSLGPAPTAPPTPLVAVRTLDPVPRISSPVRVVQSAPVARTEEPTIAPPAPRVRKQVTRTRSVAPDDVARPRTAMAEHATPTEQDNPPPPVRARTLSLD